MRVRVAASRDFALSRMDCIALTRIAALKPLPRETSTPAAAIAEGQARNVINNRLTGCADSASNGYTSGAGFTLC
jgi:hypothetical protein